MSWIGDGRRLLSTRIISSGVIPLASIAGDEGAGAGADVDVELVDGAVDGEQVERAQGADLVDAAREAAAAQDEGGLGPALRRRRRVRASLLLLAGSSWTTFPMSRGDYGRLTGQSARLGGGPDRAPRCF